MNGLKVNAKNERERKIYRVTFVGMIGNIALMLFKFVAGFVGHSAAMIADAVHSLSDLMTDFVVLIFLHISSKPVDQGHDFGHGKYETLGCVIISLALLAVGGGIFWDGVVKIWHIINGEIIPSPGMIALIAALVSIVLKEVLFRYTIRYAKKFKSPALESNAWHHRSDVLSSLGTTLGIAGAMFLGTKWRILDPLAGVIVSVVVIVVAIKILIPCMKELLDASLSPEIEKQIIDTIESVPEVKDPHNLRTRKIGNNAAVEVHVRMSPDMTVRQSHEITRQIERRLREELGEHTFINIHVEPIKDPK